MKHYVEPKTGDLVDVDTGAVVGNHDGIHNFTLGQRLRLTGMQDKVDTRYKFELKQNRCCDSESNFRMFSSPHKVFAAGKNVGENVIYVCIGSDHPSLFCDKFYVRAPLHWIAGAGPTEGDLERGFRCQFRSQNKKPLTACLLRRSESPEGTKGGSSCCMLLDVGSLTLILFQHLQKYQLKPAFPYKTIRLCRLEVI